MDTSSCTVQEATNIYMNKKSFIHTAIHLPAIQKFRCVCVCDEKDMADGVAASQGPS